MRQRNLFTEEPVLDEQKGGNGVVHCILLVRTDTPSGISEDRFNTWYNEEHIPERLAVPGFRWAARYVNVDGPGPRHLALYGLASQDVLESPEYKKLMEPGNWSTETALIFPALMGTLERYVLAVKGGHPQAFERLILWLGQADGEADEPLAAWVEERPGRGWLRGGDNDVLLSEGDDAPPAGFRVKESVRYERTFFLEA